jgi:peptidoglycan/LPS O-acetylase OafA/YrhL
MPYIPALDGIRAIAVLLVMLFHAHTPGFFGGYLGVDIFFVLSGYLITSLLLNEMAETGEIRIHRFYLKRFTRLMPPLACLLALYLLLSAWAWPDYNSHFRDALIAVFYLSDFAPIMNMSPKMLGHTWSLSVEQHYYLLWPVVLLLIVRIYGRQMVRAFVVMYLAATFWRIFCITSGQSWVMVYPRFDVRVSGLIMGALLAVWLRSRPKFSAPSMLWMAPITLAAAISLTCFAWKNPLGLMIGTTCTELLAAIMILVVLKPGESVLHQLTNSAGAIYLGKLSYGLYLYHYPVFFYLREHFDWPATLGIGLPLSLGLAALSYHSIERMSRNSRLERPVLTA